MSERLHHRKPDGTTTADFDEYVAAWRELGAPISGVLGGALVAFDPALTIRYGHLHQRHFEVPADVAGKINAALAGIPNPEAVRDVLAACHEALPHIADEYAKDRMERALAKLVQLSEGELVEDHKRSVRSAVATSAKSLARGEGEDPARSQIHRTIGGPRRRRSR